MLFTQTAASSQNASQHIVFIGTSASSFYLADLFQSAGYNVCFLVFPHLLKKYQKRGDFCIKHSRFQSKHVKFHFISALEEHCDICFISSCPGDAKKDLLLLNSKLQQPVPIINLSPFYNFKEINKLKNFKIINAFFTAQISGTKNTIELQERSSKIELFTDSEIFQQIKNIFSGSPINVHVYNPINLSFWQHLAVYFISTLLLSVYDNSISSLLNQPDIRKQTDMAISELLKLAKKDKISLDSGEILAHIYTFSDNYRGDIQSRSDFNAFSSLIKGINYFETPILSKFINLASKKY